MTRLLLLVKTYACQRSRKAEGSDRPEQLCLLGLVPSGPGRAAGRYALSAAGAVLMLALLFGSVHAQPPAPARISPHGTSNTSTRTCSLCHSLKSIFRSSLVKPADSTLCLTCHTGVRGHVPEGDCTNCHEPHARTTNAALIRLQVAGKAIRVLAKTGPDGYAGPSPLTNVSTASAMTGTVGAGLCQACHTRTKFYSTISQQSHFPGRDCMECHPHSTGFRPDPPCGSCHSLTPTSGAHEVHRDAKRGPMLGGDCNACHEPVTTWSDHMDGKVEFRDGKVLGDTAACNNCHSKSAAGTAKGRWGSSKRIACLDCHSARHPANSQADGNGDDAPGVDMYWTLNGHGRAGADVACDTCHDPDSRHIAGGAATNYRLRKLPEKLCEGCHISGGATKVSAHGNADYAGRLEGQFKVECAECHDAHGSSNLNMIKERVRDNSVRFTARSGPGSFDSSGASASNKNDLCATCHRNTGHNQVPNVESSKPHHEGEDCTRCHPHDVDGNPATVDGFMLTTACDACHGQPPPPGASGYTTFNEDRTPHRFHATTSNGGYGYDCKTCHANFPAQHLTSPPSYQSVLFGSFNPRATYNPATYTCENLYCHSDGAPRGRPIQYKNPVWGENKQLGCDGCHRGESISTGSHGAHLSAQYAQRGATSIGCYQCHSLTAQKGNNNMVADRTRHVDGQKQVAIDERGVMPTTNHPTFDANTGTCANNLCHSNGAASREQPGTPTFASPVWGQSSTARCGACHSYDMTKLGGDHKAHVERGVTDCTACHTDYDNANHVNGHVDFKDDKTLSGTGVCDTCHGAAGGINGAVEAKAKWNTGGALSCVGCHDNGPAEFNGQRAGNVFGDNKTYGFNKTGHGLYPVECEDCHDFSKPHLTAPDYEAGSNNFAAAYRLQDGFLQVPRRSGAIYNPAMFGGCYRCHLERRLVQMPDTYSNALFSHTNPPPSGYPKRGNIITEFRNLIEAGYNMDNVPANGHWDHLDMNLVIWDSDGNGKKDSLPTCLTCHDVHGVASHDGSRNYPAMTYADMGLRYGQDAQGRFGELTRNTYTRRCTACHSDTGIRYYYEAKTPVPLMAGKKMVVPNLGEDKPGFVLRRPEPPMALTRPLPPTPGPGTPVPGTPIPTAPPPPNTPPPGAATPGDATSVPTAVTTPGAPGSTVTAPPPTSEPNTPGPIASTPEPPTQEPPTQEPPTQEPPTQEPSTPKPSNGTP